MSGTRRQRPWWRRWWAIAIAVVAVLMIIGSLSPDSNGDDKSPEASTPTPSDVVSSLKVTRTKVQRATVPILKGMSLAAAKDELRGEHLKVGSVERRPSALAPGTVLSQGFRGGKHVALRSTVPLVIAIPFPRVPATAGRSGTVAAALLGDAGFRVRTIHKTVTSGTEGTVLSQSPVGGTRLRPHSLITIVVAHVVRPVVAAPPPSNCTPGYSPCLPPASDYDCSGGSGDGPKYTGLVRVTGSDPYDLDSDGDGWGCES